MAWNALVILGVTMLAAAGAHHWVSAGGQEQAEPTHPYWQVVLGYVATMVAVGVCTFLIGRLAGEGREGPWLFLMLGGVCLLVHPKAWWVWEVGAVLDLRVLLGDRLVRWLFWGLGVVLLALGLGAFATS